MIEFNHVFKSYRTREGKVFSALKEINFKVNRGEIFGVIGRSGAGKSTLVRCVNLLERPDQGKILIEDKNILTLSSKELRQMRHRIGMIFQHFNLLSSRNVYDNIALPLEFLHYSKKDIRKKIEPLLALTELENKVQAYPHQLSGGQKQRVAIARALVSDPSILLCDEATSALDIHTTHSILALLKDINKKLGVTLLMITHEMDVVKTLCDRVVLLSHGNIIESASMVEFFAHPKSELAKKLVSTVSHRSLPEKLINQIQENYFIGCSPVWRIYFRGGSAQTPLISSLLKESSLEINIFQANIETLKNETMGIMDVTVCGTEEELKKGMSFLMNSGAQVEVLGYV